MDQNTKKKVGLNYARLLVEVEIDSDPPEMIMCKNDRVTLWRKKSAMIGDQFCVKKYKKYGHSEYQCRKKRVPQGIRETQVNGTIELNQVEPRE